MSSGDLAIKAPAAVDWQHPYPGLKAFTERDSPFFYGRKAEELELFRMVKRMVLTVCFGASGLGKTSILNAGLFPRLREAFFFPVLVRLDFSRSSASLPAQIMRRIAEEAAGCNVDTAAPREGETLWEYFHRAEFWDKNSRLLAPVLVLDQFEEIFTLGTNDSRVGALVEELADLIENRIPISEQQRFTSSEDPPPFSLDRQNYRVILCLREDFLPHLEDFLPLIPSLAQNRFRLTAMDGLQAMEAILQPGREIVTENVALEVLRVACGRRATEGIADLKPVFSRLRVEPTLLSLFCHELNNRRTAAGLNNITSDLLKGSSDQIVTDFYERCMKGKTPAVRAFVEKKLLTGSGFRRAEAVEEAISLPGVTQQDIDDLVNKRLLRTEKRLEIPHVELIHDVLTKVVAASRDGRIQEEQERRLWKRIGLAAAVLAVIILGAAWWRARVQEAATLQALKDQDARIRESVLQDQLAALKAAGPTGVQQIPKPPANGEGQQSTSAACAKYADLCGYDSKRWAKDFLRDVKSGTWHVFVLSLISANEDQANKARDNYKKRFPKQDFDKMETVDASGGNHVWAIVIAEGLEDAATASRIVGFARESGIEKFAFKWRQP